MNNDKRSEASGESWTRNRMVWLVIAIPALTVAGCLLTIFLAISNPDRIVSDYKLATDTGVLDGDSD